MFLNRTDNFLVEAWLASIWKKTKSHGRGKPRHLVTLPPPAASCPLCWSYLRPRLKRATQTAYLTSGPTEEAEALEETQGRVAGGGGLQAWLLCQARSSSRLSRQPCVLPPHQPLVSWPLPPWRGFRPLGYAKRKSSAGVAAVYCCGTRLAAVGMSGRGLELGCNLSK